MDYAALVGCLQPTIEAAPRLPVPSIEHPPRYRKILLLLGYQWLQATELAVQLADYTHCLFGSEAQGPGSYPLLLRHDKPICLTPRLVMELLERGAVLKLSRDYRPLLQEILDRDAIAVRDLVQSGVVRLLPSAFKTTQSMAGYADPLARLRQRQALAAPRPLEPVEPG